MRGGANKIHTRKGVLNGDYYPRAFRREDVEELRELPDGKFIVTLEDGRTIVRTLAEVQRAK